MQQTKPEPVRQGCILWVEDRQETVEDQIYTAEKKGYKVKVVAVPHKIKEVLEQEQVVAIVMDVMLFGVHNLRSIGIETALTEGGLEAGWALLEQYLRTEKSKYAGIPVLILSTRPIDKDEDQQRRLEELRLRGGGKIDYLEKGKRGWHKEFLDWLDRLDNQLKEKNTHA